ncbi:4Fe-4S dicluster domain-containing protein [Halopseudomonas pachastrellae]|nr:4Fe-4S dicluster domain-containing protein [Halopseudomonas pachastrellae]
MHRCGLCAEACPASLLPQQLHFFALGKDYDQLKRQHLFDCIECGACSYVCPSSIPLVQYYRAAKSEIRALDLQQHKADHSRQRFEHRQERLQREAEQKERDRIAAPKAARIKAAKEAEAAKQSESGASAPASDAPAPKAGALSPEQKQLKIAAATAQMALKKARSSSLPTRITPTCRRRSRSLNKPPVRRRTPSTRPRAIPAANPLHPRPRPAATMRPKS